MKWWITLALVLVPMGAFAAGFAQQSIFLSKDTVVEGETVFIHVVISNNATTTFVGYVKIRDADVLLKAIPVSLSAGAADTYSTPWKPVAGSHEISATITTTASAPIASEKATFVVSAKPVPAAVLPPVAVGKPTDIEPSDPIEKQIENVSPRIAQSIKPAFVTLDSWRTTAAQKLFEGVTWSRTSLSSTGKEKIASSTASLPKPVQGIAQTAWIIAITIALYFFSVLRSVVSSVALFYPVLAFIILYLLWRGYRLVRRPRTD